MAAPEFFTHTAPPHTPCSCASPHPHNQDRTQVMAYRKAARVSPSLFLPPPASLFRFLGTR